MKHDRLLSWLEATLTGFFLSFAALGCLITAFSMPYVDLWLLALYCFCGALIAGFLASRRLDLILLGLLALGAGYLWQKGILLDSLESLLNKLSRVWHDAYNWPIVRWGWRTTPELEVTLPPILYILGTVLAVITAWVICKGQSSLVACLPASLPVAVCFVVTDTLPGSGWLILFFTVTAVMMMTSYTRQEDRAQGRKLALMTVLPIFLAVGILFMAVPRETYYHKEQAQAISDFFVGKNTLEQMMDRLVGKPVELEQKKVDLTTVGPRRESTGRVLQVTTRHSGGTLYLRSSSLDRYTGTTWVSSENALTTLYWPEPAEGQPVQIDEVVIKTQYAHELLYLPYYPQSLDVTGMIRGLKNANKLNEYSVTRMFLDPWAVQFEADRTISSAQQVDVEAATRLPERTKAWALPLAQQIVGNVTDPYYQALYIQGYVQNAARYDKNTAAMPKGTKDFAQWFLEESETGYCIHYATAGAVLLKALGIPARYVTGYAVNTRVGTPTDVLGTHAHAWVEYWLPGYGWTMLECTPPDFNEIPETTQPNQTIDPDQTEATIPQLQHPDTPDAPTPEDPGHSSRIWYVLLVVPAALLVWLQRRIRLWVKKRRFEKGNANRQALAKWQEAERLSKALKEPPPQPLRELAEKAKFSPYILTEEELNHFDVYLETGVTRLKKKNIFSRFWYTWILALY